MNAPCTNVGPAVDPGPAAVSTATNRGCQEGRDVRHERGVAGGKQESIVQESKCCK